MKTTTETHDMEAIMRKDVKDITAEEMFRLNGVAKIYKMIANGHYRGIDFDSLGISKKIDLRKKYKDDDFVSFAMTYRDKIYKKKDQWLALQTPTCAHKSKHEIGYYHLFYRVDGFCFHSNLVEERQFPAGVEIEEDDMDKRRRDYRRVRSTSTEWKMAKDYLDCVIIFWGFSRKNTSEKITARKIGLRPFQRFVLAAEANFQNWLADRRTA